MQEYEKVEQYRKMKIQVSKCKKQQNWQRMSKKTSLKYRKIKNLFFNNCTSWKNRPKKSFIPVAPNSNKKK